ncbi:Copper chaperone SCO1/SenC [Fimbriimonadaceae bacterium]
MFKLGLGQDRTQTEPERIIKMLVQHHSFRFGLSLAAGMLASAGFAQGYGTGTDVDPDVAFRSPKMKEIGVDQKMGAQIPLDARFTDDDGKVKTVREIFSGRPVVLLPIFYRCERTCYLELTGVVAALNLTKKLEVGRDVEVVALGINPTETWELARAKKKSILGSYSKFDSTKKSWHLLTGDMANIRKVTDSMGFRFAYDEKKNEVSHPSGIMMLTPDGKISSYSLGANYEVERFEKAIALAKEGTITEATKEIFFGCIHIDPVTGKRSLMIENVMRVLAATTVIAIVMLIFALNGKTIFRRKKSDSAIESAAE